jgi:hypothetical protein
MVIYTYSEARQNLSSLLDMAAADGKVLIRRRDGQTFALVPETVPASPLDVPSIRADVSTQSLVAIVRAGRERDPVRTRRTVRVRR